MKLKDIMVVGVEFPNGDFQWLNDEQFARILTTETAVNFGILSSRRASTLSYVSVYADVLDGTLEDRDGDNIDEYNYIQRHLADGWCGVQWSDPTDYFDDDGMENRLFFTRGDMVPVEHLASIFTRQMPEDLLSRIAGDSSHEAIKQTTGTSIAQRQPWLL